jgi:hypothetical protein
MDSAIFRQMLRFFGGKRGGVLIELNEQVAPSIIDALVVEPVLLIQFVL